MVVELIRRLLSGAIRRLLPAVAAPCESMVSYTEKGWCAYYDVSKVESGRRQACNKMYLGTFGQADRIIHIMYQTYIPTRIDE